MHEDVMPLSDVDTRRLARVLNDPARPMEIYRAIDGDEIVICGAHFDYPAFMATLRNRFAI